VLWISRGSANAAARGMKDLRIIVEVMISAFLFVAYVMVLAQIAIDLFRDRQMSGAAKAAWILALLLFPFVAVLVYIITRGKGMAQRIEAAAQRRRAQATAYVRELSGPTGVDQIARAKTLLDEGVITNDEFAALKRGALTHAGA
jgi:ABC-type multidrug transport system fused ATPase/permease subunit